jgi:chromosome segregation ATPase
MTPDEAIALVQKYDNSVRPMEDGFFTWREATYVLAAEVERLRSDLYGYQRGAEAEAKAGDEVRQEREKWKGIANRWLAVSNDQTLVCSHLREERDELAAKLEKAEESLSGWREGCTGKALAKIKAETVREACDKVLLDYRAVSFDKNENLYLNVGALRDYANQIEGGE